MGVIQTDTFSGETPNDINQGVLMTIFRSLTGLLLVSALVACGGGTGNPSQEAQSERRATEVSVAANPDLTSGKAEGLESPSYGTPVEGADLALMKQRLAKRFNGRFAGQPDALMGDRQRYAGTKAFQPVAKAYGGTPASVHRFLNIRTGSHFYTMSAEEKASIERNLPQFRYEGQAFFALTSSDVPLSPVYRFYSIYTGTHFYTIDPEERDYVRTYYWEYFNYEGIAWFATTFAGPGWMPMHRFFNNAAGTHFYTASEEERLSVIATAPHMEYEGIGYYVRTSGADIKRSPVSMAEEGSALPCVTAADPASYVMCGTAGALPLPSQVEGRRELFSTNNPRFVPVSGQSFDECSTDRYTGLIWEVKENGGVRDLVRRFTHLDRTDQPQVVVRVADGVSGAFLSVPRNPTQGELDAASNSLGYVAYVNGIRLCGFSDWRLPTSSELLNVIGIHQPRVVLPNAWGRFLSSDSADWEYDETDSIGHVTRRRVDGILTGGRDDANPFGGRAPVDFGFRAVEDGGQLSSAAMHHLVLVRGAQIPGVSRFTPTTLPYGSDAAGNVLVDGWSGLQWRRCAEGQRWTGVTCSGTPLKMHLGGALAWAANQPGWRLAGAKELETLRVHQTDLTQVQTNTQLFPVTGMDLKDQPFWSMSMKHNDSFNETPPGSGQYVYSQWVDSFQVNFGAASVGTNPVSFLRRVSANSLGHVRLVRVHP